MKVRNQPQGRSKVKDWKKARSRREYSTVLYTYEKDSTFVRLLYIPHIGAVVFGKVLMVAVAVGWCMVQVIDGLLLDFGHPMSVMSGVVMLVGVS